MYHLKGFWVQQLWCILKALTPGYLCILSWQKHDLCRLNLLQSVVTNVFAVLSLTQTCSHQLHSYWLSSDSTARLRSSQMVSGDKAFCSAGVFGLGTKNGGSFGFIFMFAELQMCSCSPDFFLKFLKWLSSWQLDLVICTLRKTFMHPLVESSPLGGLKIHHVAFKNTKILCCTSFCDISYINNFSACSVLTYYYYYSNQTPFTVHPHLFATTRANIFPNIIIQCQIHFHFPLLFYMLYCQMHPSTVSDPSK